MMREEEADARLVEFGICEYDDDDGDDYASCVEITIVAVRRWGEGYQRCILAAGQ